MLAAAAAFTLLSLGLAHAQSTSENPCLADCTGTGAGRVCIFRFEIDIFASETGYYRVEGCEGVMPTLGMEPNVTYIFDQSHPTNWFHPLGFAYGPDGVYRENEELEKGVPAPGGAIACDATTPCQYAQYLLDNEPLCDSDPCDVEDFGLDQYEGVWFSGGRDDWIDAGAFTVNVTINDPATTEIFYFCHIHNDMSGRIKILDGEEGAPVDATDLTPIPYAYHTVSGFDVQCGTYNVSQYEDVESECPDMQFSCNQDASLFARCMSAVNCKMHVEMRTSLATDPTAQFMYHMIPHHANAVNMAKILLKLNPGSLKCGTSYDGRRMLDESFCHDNNNDGGTPAVTLLWDIINTQNQQITFMRSWLEDNLQPSHDYCHDEDDNTELIIALSSVLGAIVLGTAAAFAFYKFYYKPRQAARLEESKLASAA